jgi:hypothetical protein
MGLRDILNSAFRSAPRSADSTSEPHNSTTAEATPSTRSRGAWEYKVVDVHALLQRGPEGSENLERSLNALGKERWELVTIVEDRATFKRHAQ